jgi:hypothetical protein
MLSRSVLSAALPTIIVFVALIMVTALPPGGKCITCFAQSPADAQSSAVKGTIAAGQGIEQVKKGGIFSHGVSPFLPLYASVR